MFHRLSSAAEVIAVALACAAWIPTPASAEPQPHDVGIFADSAGTQSTLEVQGMTVFNVYGVAFGLDGLVKGWEMAVEYSPQFTVLSLVYHPANCDGCWGDRQLSGMRTGTGGCFSGEPTYPLWSASLGWFGSTEVPGDTTFCVRPYPEPSPALNGRPGYLQCDGDLVPFGLAQNGGEFYPDGCLVLNPTHPLEGPVALEDIGLGALKARFHSN